MVVNERQKKRKTRKNKKIIGRGSIDDEYDEESGEIIIPTNSGIDIILIDKTNDEIAIKQNIYSDKGLIDIPKFQIRIEYKEESKELLHTILKKILMKC